MREVNFSIPNVNKASVHITTTLYDRRALDCTSTLPLINSLNSLAGLTTSSARIRDILTVDGGIERLVCILKQGKNTDLLDMWKWNLAFQCVCNIGVRGSENVRTRVVEADMVPVIATILNNYIQIVERMKARADADHLRPLSRTAIPPINTNRSRDQVSRSSFFERSNGNPDHRQSRRQAPPPSIEIPQPYSHSQQNAEPNTMETTPTPQMALTSPPERTTFPRPQLHHHNRSHDNRHQPSTAQRLHALQPLATAVPSMDTTDGFSLRPVRDAERLPSMLPSLQSGIISQPDSPTTPSAPPQHARGLTSTARNRRPSIRQQRSTSGDSDDPNGDDSAGSDEAGPAESSEPIVDVQRGMSIQNVEDADGLLESSTTPLPITIPNPSEAPEAETFNITHRSSVDGSIINTTTPTVTTTLGRSPIQQNTVAPNLMQLPQNVYPPTFRNTTTSPTALPAIPRDEDVLQSLQLLAYISKYCSLRTYFQKTHLVPKLKLARDITATDDIPAQAPTAMDVNEDDEDEEYLLPDDFNIFPLVEKFTVRHHSKDMQYWAQVVMRNLCRKDESKGGIRQCAYYECGKWEEFTRQFAKCRRCRRTKYCSKDCQKSAWVYHRHWCRAPPTNT